MRYVTMEDALNAAPKYSTRQQMVAWARGYNEAAKEANDAVQEAERLRESNQRLRDQVQTLRWDLMQAQHELGERAMGPDW